MAGHHSVAFVDESHLKGPHSAGFYLLAAVIVDQTAVEQARSAMRAAVGTGRFHANELHRDARFRVVEDALDTVAAHAGWVHIVTHTPLDVGKEIARQRCLSQLLQELNRQRVRDVIMDTRGADPSPEERDHNDIRDRRTYRQLVREGTINPRMAIRHQHSHDEGSWMADVAAWATQRVLRTDDPVWWNRIADIATVTDAVTGTDLKIRGDGGGDRAALPAGDHGPQRASQSAPPLLSPSAYPPAADLPPQYPNATLTDLAMQSLYARQAQSRLENKLSRSIAELSDEVRNLHHTIRRIAALRTPQSDARDVAPSAPDTDSPSSLDRNGDTRALE
ncbi:hypothetical protein J2S43_001092 [Catenuloplanes nepalensis]|uniref:DUF3800 domain-containing protein n=1 Tax=Catenuloplanes nepalensis TaxID=587533 RepID=A0ABT9MMF7_9ACTN|nr:hypothetical protein [Catenuloplanes nepalensis]MDP9792580.1 hypothetical protein [Catenuloplanes nepalensis]